MKISESNIPFSYKTINVTKGRIDKGLLAIPVSLIDFFQNNKTKIYVHFGYDYAIPKKFTPYSSSSRECRIGGMRDFFEKYKVKEGDELVIQMLDDEKYRILPEKQFEGSVRRMENAIDKSKNEKDVDTNLKRISEITNLKFKETVLREFYRLSKNKIIKRSYANPSRKPIKENVSASVRKLLAEIYKGRCQISDFWFLMKNSKPYFEIHHIHPNLGTHFKNLLVVCSNVHAQLTYANIEHHFDNDGWLRKVKINEKVFLVNQIISKIPKLFEKEIHYL